MRFLGGTEEGKMMDSVYYKRRNYLHRKKGRHEGGREGREGERKTFLKRRNEDLKKH